MTHTLSLNNRLWSERKLITGLTIIFANLLLIVSAQVSIPLQPIPITMQVVAVLALALSLGWRLSFMAYAAYLLEGSLGLPVFANGGAGVAVILGPHGGYLMGFGAAMLVCGALAEKGYCRHVLSTMLVGLLGVTLIYAGGLAWFSHLVGFNAAWQLGIVPFIGLDALKVMAVALLVPRLWHHQ